MSDKYNKLIYLFMMRRGILFYKGQLQKEYVPLLKKDLKQRRKIGRHRSERARQRSDVPKTQHYGRHKDDERQDHNTDTPF